MAGSARTYLVTGVAGFIAARVAGRLLAEGHRVVGVDSLNDYYDVRLKDHRLSHLLGRPFAPAAEARRSVFADAAVAREDGAFAFHPLDVEDRAGVERLFAAERFDAVLHLAARAGVRASLEAPHAFLATNTTGALNVLEAMRRHGVTKLVLASTSSVYAGCPVPYREDQPVGTPLSPYAATKQAAELLAHAYHRLYGLDVSVLRYFTVFGPAGRPDMSPFRFIEAVIAGRPLEIHGDGTQTRDFTFVEDIARGTVLALRPLGYEIVNLGGGRRPLALLDAIALMERFAGRAAQRVHRPFHAADVADTAADIGKADRLLGWRPEVDVEDGFRRTVEWHLANRSWLATLRV
jgi:nucleoside-diphosphate-sugar epimerase